VVELIAKAALDLVAPVAVDGARLVCAAPGMITAIMPYGGAEAALSKALQAAHGMAFPAPNRATGKLGARCVWTGRAQAMLIGPGAGPALAAHAAIADQSDGWAIVTLQGAQAVAVLARLTPLDLRDLEFKRGHTARSELRHMPVSITRVGVRTFDIMVFRSMAQSALHELESAMKRVAAQA